MDTAEMDKNCLISVETSGEEWNNTEWILSDNSVYISTNQDSDG